MSDDGDTTPFARAEHEAMRYVPETDEPLEVLLDRLPAVLTDRLTKDVAAYDGHTRQRIVGVRPISACFELVEVRVDGRSPNVAVLFTWRDRPGRTFGMWWDLSDHFDDCMWWSEPNAAGVATVITVSMEEDLLSVSVDLLAREKEIPEIDGVVWLRGQPPSRNQPTF